MKRILSVFFTFAVCSLALLVTIITISSIFGDSQDKMKGTMPFYSDKLEKTLSKDFLGGGSLVRGVIENALLGQSLYEVSLGESGDGKNQSFVVLEKYKVTSIYDWSEPLESDFDLTLESIGEEKFHFVPPSSLLSFMEMIDSGRAENMTKVPELIKGSYYLVTELNDPYVREGENEGVRYLLFHISGLQNEYKKEDRALCLVIPFEVKDSPLNQSVYDRVDFNKKINLLFKPLKIAKGKYQSLDGSCRTTLEGVGFGFH